MAGVIDKLKNKTWIQNNTFSVTFFDGPLAGLEHCIKSVQMPDFTRSAVEEYNNGTWQFAPGRQEMYQIAMTFIDNEEDIVYAKALEHWTNNNLKYREEQEMKFMVNPGTRKDRSDDSGSGVKFIEVMIDSISGLQWDNSSQNQIVEFTINFKSAKFRRT